jgi:hypothetical protein
MTLFESKQFYIQILSEPTQELLKEIIDNVVDN